MITNTAGSVDKGSGYKFVLSSARQKLSEDNKDKGLDRCILFPSSLNHKKESFFFFFFCFFSNQKMFTVDAKKSAGLFTNQKMSRLK